MKNMNRIEKLFSQSKAFIAYLTAGDGGIEKTFESALALIEGGVNMLEIGVPFSDPIADGPVIQRAASRALRSGTCMRDVLCLVKKIRAHHSDIPLILFTYYNPILAVLNTSFMQDAKQAGVDGILLVDCPLEESQLFYEKCLEQQIAPIHVITPSTSRARIRKMDAHGHGFLYFACRKGTTGLRQILPNDFVENMQQIKSAVHLPVIAGFGISNSMMAEQVLQYADGVVIGSLFVKAIEDGCLPSELTHLAREICPLAKVTTS